MSGETEEQVSGWTVDTLRGHLAAVVADLARRIDEHFIADEKASNAAFAVSDKAVDKALAAAEKAVDTALHAAEKAVDVRTSAVEREFHAHLEQVRHETAVAFQSSDRAITKAEIATEKRFESSNAFREQLRDQAQSFVTRVEASAIDSRNSERIDDTRAEVDAQYQRTLSRLAEIDTRSAVNVTREEMATLAARANESTAALTAQLAVTCTRVEMISATEANTDRIQALTDRMNRSEGRGSGLNAGWIYLLGAVAALGTIVSLYLALKP